MRKILSCTTLIREKREDGVLVREDHTPVHGTRVVLFIFQQRDGYSEYLASLTATYAKLPPHATIKGAFELGDGQLTPLAFLAKWINTTVASPIQNMHEGHPGDTPNLDDSVLTPGRDTPFASRRSQSVLDFSPV